MTMNRLVRVLGMLCLWLVSGGAAWAQELDTELFPPERFSYREVLPNATDARITRFNFPHRVFYDPNIGNNKLLVFLTGTTDSPGFGPKYFFRAGLDQGYRVINLVYISDPAVSQTCASGSTRLKNNPECAQQFRHRRLWGNNNFNGISDQVQDAIVNRLQSLLIYLRDADPVGDWGQYLKADNTIEWDMIAVSGQSQGGGMAQYLGKKKSLWRVLSFSGGWDYRNAQKDLAAWYTWTPVTPPDRWYYAYHAREGFAADLKRIAGKLKVPSSNTYANNGPITNTTGDNPGHTSSIQEPQYQPVWLEMLGSGL